MDSDPVFVGSVVIGSIVVGSVVVGSVVVESIVVVESVGSIFVGYVIVRSVVIGSVVVGSVVRQIIIFFLLQLSFFFGDGFSYLSRSPDCRCALEALWTMSRESPSCCRSSETSALIVWLDKI